jgi:hypothetical protein
MNEWNGDQPAKAKGMRKRGRRSRKERSEGASECFCRC